MPSQTPWTTNGTGLIKDRSGTPIGMFKDARNADYVLELLPLKKENETLKDKITDLKTVLLDNNIPT